MLLKALVTGALAVNTYLLLCEESKEGAVIDPGGKEDEIWRFFNQRGAKLKYIINTHGHPDHFIGNSKLKELSQAKIVIHQEDVHMLVSPHPLILAMTTQSQYVPTPADVAVKQGDEIQVGTLFLQVIHTPGHSPGGMSLLTNEIIFTGDTLFASSIGRTDLPGGSYSNLMHSIKEKILPLGPEFRVLPGHGPSSTIREEQEYNPYLT